MQLVLVVVRAYQILAEDDEEHAISKQCNSWSNYGENNADSRMRKVSLDITV